MTRSLQSLLTGLVLACGTVSGIRGHSADADLSGHDLRTVRFDGFGAVKIGMSVAEASSAVGLEVNYQDPDYSTESCEYVSSPELTGIAFMVVEKKIVRMDVLDSRYRTSA